MHQSVPTLIVGGWTRVPAWNKYPQNCTNVKKPVNRSQANVKTEGKKKRKKFTGNVLWVIPKCFNVSGG